MFFIAVGSCSKKQQRAYQITQMRKKNTISANKRSQALPHPFWWFLLVCCVLLNSFFCNLKKTGFFSEKKIEKGQKSVTSVTLAFNYIKINVLECYTFF